MADADGLESLIARSRERAALVGAFDPLKLVGDDHEQATVRSALRVLADDCDELPSPNGFHWRLKPDIRRVTLDGLRQTQRLEEVARSVQPEAADVFGLHLAAAVLGQAVEPESLATEVLDELHTALQFAAVPVPAAAQLLHDVETTLARRERDAAIRIVLPRKLIGREQALQQLRDFVAGGPATALSVLRVTGVGGSGKSALLAGFANELSGQGWNGIPVIWLDFDRAALTTADPIAMLVEFSRQLVLCRPSLREPLAAFRKDLRDRVNARDDPTTEGYDASAALESEMWSIWQQHLAATLPITEPVVLILDTFEEILVRGESESAHIQRWLHALAAEGQVSGLRPILSGRSLPGAAFAAVPGASAPEIELGDLLPKPAGLLLTDYLERAGRAPGEFPTAALVRKLGGNPLLLKILARYLSEQGVGAAQDLLTGKDDGEFDRRFAQTFLYTRILKRIRTDDPDIERLAHPGLALRRVTPELIRRVLAAPCGLQQVGLDRADSLFDKLSRQVWLVERTDTPQVVQHRRDLRRLMIHAMTTVDCGNTKRIHRRAAGYYRFGLDRFLSPREQRFESHYHAFMGAPHPPMPSAEDLRPFLVYIGEDFENLPVRWRARLKFEAQRSLTDEEFAALDQTSRLIYVRRVSDARMKRGDDGSPQIPVPPVSIPADSHAGSVKAVAPMADPYDTVFSAFGGGALMAVRRQAKAAIDEFVDLVTGSRPQTEALPSDLTEHALWRAALATLAVGGGEELADMLSSRMNERRLEWARPVNPTRRDSVGVGVAMAMVFSLLGRELPDPLRNEVDRIPRNVQTVEGLRAYELLGARKPRPPVTIGLQLLCDLDNSIVSAITNRRQYPTLRFDAPGALKQYATFERTQVGDRPRITLANLQRYRSRDWLVTVQTWPQLVEEKALLRGCTPELHPAVRGVVQPLSIGFLQDYASHAQARVRWWPDELGPDELGPALERDRSRWTATLIEFADRSGLLLDFVRFCTHRAPKSESLAQVERMCTAYDHRLRGMPDPAKPFRRS